MMRLGAVGELTGWAFDAEGRIIDGGTNLRLTSIPPHVPAEALTIGAAVGPAKVPAISGGAQGTADQRPDHRRGDRKAPSSSAAKTGLGSVSAAGLPPADPRMRSIEPSCRRKSGAEAPIPILDNLRSSV